MTLTATLGSSRDGEGRAIPGGKQHSGSTGSAGGTSGAAGTADYGTNDDTNSRCSVRIHGNTVHINGATGGCSHPILIIVHTYTYIKISYNCRQTITKNILNILLFIYIYIVFSLSVYYCCILLATVRKILRGRDTELQLGERWQDYYDSFLVRLIKIGPRLGLRHHLSVRAESEWRGHYYYYFCI